MLFSSQVFLLAFLPLAVAAYYAVARSEAPRLWVLVLASVAFYGWWDPRFLPLITGSVLGNWWLASRDSGPGLDRRALVLGVALNLALLAVFKYTNFALASAAVLTGTEPASFDIVLPLGISFFTFQQISYLVDKGRGQAPAYPLPAYAAYVMFFPQLIAGPIVRHNQLIPQLALSPLREGVYARCGAGLALFTLGLVKKVFFADELAGVADPVFAGAGDPGAQQAWLGALAYTFQLYFDFSAYSDMAIGLGHLFGLTLPLNFDQPYRALSVREFWRRWHITLSDFLRDYVYVPLGGSRAGGLRLAVAVMATMLLCGLWHGAGWTFVVWGGLHGAAVLVNRLWQRAGIALPAPGAWLLTMLFVVLGWVLFRAEDFGVAAGIWRGMAGLNGPGASDEEAVRLTLAGGLFAVLGPTAVQLAGRPWMARPAAAVAAGVLLAACILRVGAGRSLEFIYFQF